MKCAVFIGGLVACLLVFFEQGSAQIYNQTCQSAEYARMMNRNAATDAADIVVYNPAGLVDLTDGFHLNVSNQVWFRRPTHTFIDPLSDLSIKYTQEGTDWLIPNLHAAYKKEDWSVFGAVYIPGGGASLKYPEGSFSTRVLGSDIVGPDGPAYPYYQGIAGEHIEGSSLYLAASIGGAFRLSDNVSIAAGIRTVSVKNRIEGGLTLTDSLLGPWTPDTLLSVRVEEKDTGWGSVFGIQVKPDENLTIALHLESQVRLNLRTDIMSGDNISEEAGLFVDGGKSRRDLPYMIGIGASYRFTPRLRGEVDFNYWFQKAADWGRTLEGRNMSGLAGDSWSIGAAVAYQILPPVEISFGMLYTNYCWEDLDAYYNANLGAVEVFYSDDIMFGAGFAYKIYDNLTLNLGLGYIIYKGETIDTSIGEVDIKNTSSSAVAMGFDFSL